MYRLMSRRTAIRKWLSEWIYPEIWKLFDEQIASTPVDHTHEVEVLRGEVKRLNEIIHTKGETMTQPKKAEILKAMDKAMDSFVDEYVQYNCATLDVQPCPSHGECVKCELGPKDEWKLLRKARAYLNKNYPKPNVPLP